MLVSLILIAVCGQACCQSSGRDFNGSKWIWHPEAAKTVYFRKVVSLDKPVEAFDILITADDSFEVWVNSRMIGSGGDWQKPQTLRGKGAHRARRAP